MSSPSLLVRASPLLGAAFGLLGGVYFAETGRSLSYRAGGGEPLLPVDGLFDIHPALGIAVFTLVGFGLGLLQRHLQQTYGIGY